MSLLLELEVVLLSLNICVGHWWNSVWEVEDTCVPPVVHMIWQRPSLMIVFMGPTHTHTHTHGAPTSQTIITVLT